MTVVMRAVRLEGFAFEGTGTVQGNWLESYDVDAHGGLGEAVWTDNKAKAMRFANIGEAFNTWKKQSIVRPLRPDGEPNRPLTAFTITFEDA